MFGRLWRMLVKEFLQMLRDPRMMVIVFVVPVGQMTVLAFALTTDVTHIETAVFDMDKTPASRELLSRFASSGYFDIVEAIHSEAEVDQLLDRGAVRGVLRFPAGFERDVEAGRTAQVQFLSDGTDSISASAILTYADQIVSEYAREQLMKRLGAQYGGPLEGATVRVAPRSWFNPNLRSELYYVPALIGVMLMVVSMLLTSIAIVREKEIGTIEQIMVTPIRRSEFILGKTVPFLVTSYITMTLMLIIAWIVFEVQISGSVLLLYVMTGVYLVGNLGLALFVSVGARTQQQALLTAFFILMPGILLSGFLFPIRNMPLLVQYVTLLNPMRWFLEILRGILLRGAGVAALWKPMLAQTILAVLFTTLAAATFRKTLT